MFDSPFEFCPACDAYVVLDQTLRECAREHRCDDVSKCPLQTFFTGIEFAGTKIVSEPQGASTRNEMPLLTSR
jgi:hypothetical protein